MQRQKKAKENNLKLYLGTKTYFIDVVCKSMELSKCSSLFVLVTDP